MKIFPRNHHIYRAFRFFLISSLFLQLLHVSQARANLITDQKVGSEFILIAIIVLGAEASLVTWLFRRRGFNRLFLWVALFIVNLMTWVLFFNVYRSIVENIYLFEGCIVVLEGAAIYYISRLPFVRSESSRSVGMLGAAGSSALGNLFSWGLGTLILFLVIYFKGMQKGFQQELAA